MCFRLTNPIIPLNCGSVVNMATIMEEVEDIFLDTVVMKADDPEARKSDVVVAKSSDATSEERKVAEEKIWSDIKQTGEMIVHCDVGVVEGIEGAKRIRDH